MVLQNAKLKRLAMQVEYHTDLEKRWLPWWLIKRIVSDRADYLPQSKFLRTWENCLFTLINRSMNQ